MNEDFAECVRSTHNYWECKKKFEKDLILSKREVPVVDLVGGTERVFLDIFKGNKTAVVYDLDTTAIVLGKDDIHKMPF